MFDFRPLRIGNERRATGRSLRASAIVRSDRAAVPPSGRNLRPLAGVSSVVSTPSTRIVQARAAPARHVEILGG
jgi:hypothetical protein